MHHAGADLCMHDYKSLPIAAMICATLVNTQTHSSWPVILLSQTTGLKIQPLWQTELLTRTHIKARTQIQNPIQHMSVFTTQVYTQYNTEQFR